MGLELVEILMKVEDQFEISIMESEVYEADTVGKFVDVVYSRLRKNQNDPCPSQHAFYLIRKEFMQTYEVSRSKIMPETKLSQIIPKKNRRKLWAKAKTTLFPQNSSSIDLVLPKWLHRTVTLLIPIAIFLYAFSILPIEIIWIGIFPALFSRWFLLWILTPLKTEFPKEHSKIKDLIPLISTTCPKIWTKSEVFEKIREITVQVIGVKSEFITLESHWINDLGVD